MVWYGEYFCQCAYYLPTVHACCCLLMLFSFISIICRVVLPSLAAAGYYFIINVRWLLETVLSHTHQCRQYSLSLPFAIVSSGPSSNACICSLILTKSKSPSLLYAPRYLHKNLTITPPPPSLIPLLIPPRFPLDFDFVFHSFPYCPNYDRI